MDRRIDRLSRAFGGRDDCGPLAIIAPNSWSDADRDAWERAQILNDETTRDDLIEKYTGQRPRPCHAARPHINIVIVPAPLTVEEANEEERAACREGGACGEETSSSASRSMSRLSRQVPSLARS